MRAKTSAGLLAVLILTLLTAACKNDGGTSILGPKFIGLSISGSKIRVIFDTALSGTPDAVRITVKKGTATLTHGQGADYTLSIDGKNLVITLNTTPKIGERYTVELGAGAVQDAFGNNSEAPASSAKITVTAGVVLTIPPYILGNTIIATFNRQIALRDWNKVNVRKNPARANSKIKLTEAGITVDAADKTRLKIILPPVANGEVYRLALEAGAVDDNPGQDRKTADENKAIAPENLDITIEDGPALVTDAKPVFKSKTEFSVNFQADVVLLNTAAIKVESKAGGEQDFTELTGRKIALDRNDAKKINFTLNQEATASTSWKVNFPAESLISPGRVANTTELLTDEGISKSSYIYTWTEVKPPGDAAKITSGDGPNWWAGRTSHASTVFHKKIWVMGGNDDENSLNDVWSSTDGATWAESKPPNKVAKTTDGASPNWWTARYDHTSVVFKNKIWVLAGSDGEKLNDVWSSIDGATWTESKPPNKAAKTTDGASPNWWVARYGHTSVVFDDGNGEKIWVLGGRGKKTFLNDVWHSMDGSTWTEAVPPPGDAAKITSGDGTNWWEARSFHTSVVFHDGDAEKIWVLGGNGYNNLTVESWYSQDGKSWLRAVDIDRTPFSVLYAHASMVYNGRIWNLAGIPYRNTVSSSADPTQAWLQEKDPIWLGRNYLTGVTFQDKMWILGGSGSGSTLYNDVWTLAN